MARKEMENVKTNRISEMEWSEKEMRRADEKKNISKNAKWNKRQTKTRKSVKKTEKEVKEIREWKRTSERANEWTEKLQQYLEKFWFGSIWPVPWNFICQSFMLQFDCCCFPIVVSALLFFSMAQYYYYSLLCARFLFHFSLVLCLICWCYCTFPFSLYSLTLVSFDFRLSYIICKLITFSFIDCISFSFIFFVNCYYILLFASNFSTKRKAKGKKKWKTNTFVVLLCP